MKAIDSLIIGEFNMRSDQSYHYPFLSIYETAWGKKSSAGMPVFLRFFLCLNRFDESKINIVSPVTNFSDFFLISEIFWKILGILKES